MFQLLNLGWRHRWAPPRPCWPIAPSARRACWPLGGDRSACGRSDSLCPKGSGVNGRNAITHDTNYQCPLIMRVFVSMSIGSHFYSYRPWTESLARRVDFINSRKGWGNARCDVSRVTHRHTWGRCFEDRKCTMRQTTALALHPFLAIYSYPGLRHHTVPQGR